MDNLKTERSFNSQATWVINVLGFNFDMLSMGFAQAVNWCRNRMSVLYKLILIIRPMVTVKAITEKSKRQKILEPHIGLHTGFFVSFLFIRLYQKHGCFKQANQILLVLFKTYK